MSRTWPRYSGDFFPYIDEANGYWTGFYTSRPVLKGIPMSLPTAHHTGVDWLCAGLVARSSALLQSMEMMLTTSVLHANATHTLDTAGLVDLRRAVAEAQHHDAVTGTALPNVVCSAASDWLT